MISPSQSKAVVFLDRDGTLNVEAGYLRNISDLVLIEGAAQAVSKLNKAGVAAVLVTNQSGPARNYYPETHVMDLHARLAALLAEQSAYLDAIYYCSHLADGIVADYAKVCACRKPGTGMVDWAFAEHPELDRSRAFVVGDKVTDIELARNCGAKGILVLTGYGQSVLSGNYQSSIKADFEALSIVEAVDWILCSLGHATS